MLSLVYIVFGLLALSYGADFFVRGAASIAKSLGISPLAVGLTIVAFGTSAPELFISVRAALSGTEGIALGNVVGSNIFNLLVVIGGCAIFAPVEIPKNLVRRDIPVLLASTALFFFTSMDGVFTQSDGFLLSTSLILYIIFLFITSNGENDIEEIKDLSYLHSFLLSSIGLLGLTFGSDFFVEGASILARYFGISEFVIGATIVAIGTSLPEVATSIAATFKGQRDIAIGNAIGSNVFNILSVVGFTSLLRDLHISTREEHIDCYIMYAVTFLTALLIAKSKVISKLSGSVLVLLYALFLIHQLL